eukprot:scaffold45432_cov60-Phaeocystis_antarctica.AAC.1
MPTRVTTSLQVSSTQQRASQLKAAARAHAATLEQEAEDERRRGGASIALRDEQGMIVPEPPAVESRKVMVSLYGPDGELQLVTKEEAASRAAHELAQAAASAEHARLMARRAGAARGRGAVAAARRLLLEGLLAGYERCIAALSRSTSQGEGAGPRAARMSVWRELGSMMVQEGKDGSVRRARCVGTVVWLLQQDKLPQRDSARAQLAWLIDNFVDPVRAFDRTTRCERSLASSTKHAYPPPSSHPLPPHQVPTPRSTPPPSEMDARDARLAESVLRGFLGATPLDGRGDDGASLRHAATEANRRLWELHPSSARDRRRAYDARRQQQLHSAEDANGSQSASTAGLSSLPLSRATSPGLAGAASSPSCRRSSAASTASLASTAAAPSRAGGKPGVRGPWGVAAPAAPYAAAPTRRPTARLLHRLLAASAAAEQQRHDAHFGSVCVELVPPTRHWLEEEPGTEESGWAVDETPAVALRRKLAAAQEQSSLAAARLRAGQVVIETFEPSVLSRPAEAEANVAEDRAARRRETEARRALDVEAARSEASARSERTEAARAELAARWEREAAVAHARSQAEMGQLAERAAKEEGARLAAFAATSWEVEAAAAAARDATLRELEEYEATMLAEQRARLDKEAALMKALEMAPTPADTDAANARAGLGPVAELSAGEAWLRHGAGFADAADD